MDPDIGDVIARRKYRLVDGDNDETWVKVLVGRPQPAKDAPEYQCAFQVVGIGNQIIQVARGCDSIQALQSALILVSANLNHLNNELGRKLVWDGGRNGELGFP